MNQHSYTDIIRSGNMITPQQLARCARTRCLMQPNVAHHPEARLAMSTCSPINYAAAGPFFNVVDAYDGCMLWQGWHNLVTAAADMQSWSGSGCSMAPVKLFHHTAMKYCHERVLYTGWEGHRMFHALCLLSPASDKQQRASPTSQCCQGCCVQAKSTSGHHTG